jgi:tetratricopeptide (TPR) repeat protein
LATACAAGSEGVGHEELAVGAGREAVAAADVVLGAEEAETALRKGIELAPDNAAALVLLARVVAPVDVSEGLTLARRAVDAEPAAANYYVLADMLVRSGARGEALGALEKAMTLAPGERRYRQTYEQLKSQP